MEYIVALIVIITGLFLLFGVGIVVLVSLGNFCDDFY